jgi:hypothetical protein
MKYLIVILNSLFLFAGLDS